MNINFRKFSSDIKLTSNQRDDATVKKHGVAEKLHNKYYQTKYNGSTSFTFGSDKNNLNIRPFSESQDVDFIFKISKEVFHRFYAYSSNGPSALLNEIKEHLQTKYTSTDVIKVWVHVVHINFSENKHNIEVLPAYEKDDGTFLIPNTKNGGSWDEFDPRNKIKIYNVSNSKTNGLTGDLIRMLKVWKKNTVTLSYESYKLVDDVIDFLNREFIDGASYKEYPIILKNYFEFKKNRCSPEIKSHLETAFNRSVNAIQYQDQNKLVEASREWQKIFCNFPLILQNPKVESVTKNREIIKPTAPWSY